jgi:hypothetical protein
MIIVSYEPCTQHVNNEQVNQICREPHSSNKALRAKANADQACQYERKEKEYVEHSMIFFQVLFPLVNEPVSH